jgi:nitrite reductase/ring-hydroxylating ferredoxin subunit
LKFVTEVETKSEERIGDLKVIMEVELKSLTEGEVAVLKVGVNVLHGGTKQGLLVHKDGNGALRACENVCKHQGGVE